MRKITQEAIYAFTSSKIQSFRKDNTQVIIYGTEKEPMRDLVLHGNIIARRCKDTYSISSAGWFSNTTKERLNGIPGVSIQQKKWKWYLNGTEWDGLWITI